MWREYRELVPELSWVSLRQSTAALYLPESTAFRAGNRFDVLSSTPAAASLRASCIHRPLRCLATIAREKSGLVLCDPLTF